MVKANPFTHPLEAFLSPRPLFLAMAPGKRSLHLANFYPQVTPMAKTTCSTAPSM